MPDEQCYQCQQQYDKQLKKLNQEKIKLIKKFLAGLASVKSFMKFYELQWEWNKELKKLEC